MNIVPFIMDKIYEVMVFQDTGTSWTKNKWRKTKNSQNINNTNSITLKDKKLEVDTVTYLSSITDKEGGSEADTTSWTEARAAFL